MNYSYIDIYIKIRKTIIHIYLYINVYIHIYGGKSNTDEIIMYRWY